MNQIFNSIRKPALTSISFAALLVVSSTAWAGHFGGRPYHPAAEAHMNTAIRLMNIACNKPVHVSKSLARAAVTHVSLAQRFVRKTAAQAELCGAKASLERFVYGHCAPPFHPAIRQTQLALDIERHPCASCGQPACHGECQIPPPVIDPGIGSGHYPAPHPEYTHHRGTSFRRHGNELDRYAQPFGQPRRNLNPLAELLRQFRFGP